MKNNNFKDLKQKAFEANINLWKSGLVIFTFGNVSEIDRENNVFAIKPSGVDYQDLVWEKMVLVSLNGDLADEGSYRPSSDTKTHLELYKAFPEVGGIAHSHSRYATAIAQARIPLNCLGTTHADYFYGDVPCTELISDVSIKEDYEKNTGKLIASTFLDSKIDYLKMKACLVACHGPFTWGKNAEEAVFCARILEEIALQFCFTKLLNPYIDSIKKTLLNKHYLRKHGKDAYYGQK
ncbi:MAG: L-ribulose-5-phosphate 4-epimerase AraD [Actinobacteria bacterium]|nr:L-ribulose-5-phosphate 4-epimerase AraD [Actinomycetota bacterium]